MAAVTAIAWTVAVGFGLPVVGRVVTVLVIACPHALGLAVPLVVAINTSLAASNGILVRDRIAMEQARVLDTIVFDKTGTLTEGEQGVVDIATTADWREEDVLSLMAAAEGDSEHMIAEAIREEARNRGVSVPNVRGFEALKGRGVRATVELGASANFGGDAESIDDNETIFVGGPNLLRYLEVEPNEDLQTFAEEAGSQAVRGGCPDP